MHNDKKDIAPRKQPLLVLIAAGGTGGHVYPAIAIADALKKLDSTIEIQFVGTKSHMEWEAVPRAGYEISSIWISGFHRRLTPKNLLFPLKLVTSLVQSLNIISSFKPDAMIACGGYAAGPVGWVASKRHVPLFIQEQNSFPGVTNRLLAKNAERIFTAFKEADRYFPADKTEIAGNPTRDSLTKASVEEAYTEFTFSDRKSTLLVLGGSGGARSINEAMKTNLDQLHNELDLQIIWQCGKQYIDDLEAAIDTDEYPQLRLAAFLHNMPEAYAVSDVVVSRAGALSCSELAVTGKASILVPSPNVAGDHQTKNAESMVEQGAALMMADDEASNLLPKLVKELMENQQQIKNMQQAALQMARPNAAGEIAQEILDVLKSKES